MIIWRLRYGDDGGGCDGNYDGGSGDDGDYDGKRREAKPGNSTSHNLRKQY